ncbi:response regulator [Maridesulfovibrio hydrothermalis]|uniref:Response regulator receiver protein n=1 Tax=Maridesulfovibrio hydrothermalis AM13 = DSM 14728 TaxID=1121451 RepID=L0RBJ9_9BACT|nr:response regulator [Maridesulfovibrio hydrothermalis]CCO23602.1 Response regulator receiver protein [Maridesulfovibrio hydrothermalis AM13 = DSM 14728]
MNILLVDDERINSLSASRLLEKHGHTVTVAVNGVDALEKVAEGDFDCILMDIQMPEMDGYEATARIRDEAVFGEKSKTPIIAMTGHSYSDAENEITLAGINYFVCKPFDIPTLLSTIAKAVAEAD